MVAGLLVLSLRISAQTNGEVCPEASPKDVVSWMRIQATATLAMRHYMSTGEPLPMQKESDLSGKAVVTETNASVSNLKPGSSLSPVVPKLMVASTSAVQPVNTTFLARPGQGLIFWDKSDWIKHKQILLEEQRQTPASEPVWFPCLALPSSAPLEAAAPVVRYKFIYDFKITPSK